MGQIPQIDFLFPVFSSRSMGGVFFSLFRSLSSAPGAGHRIFFLVALLFEFRIPFFFRLPALWRLLPPCLSELTTPPSSLSLFFPLSPFGFFCERPLGFVVCGTAVYLFVTYVGHRELLAIFSCLSTLILLRFPPSGTLCLGHVPGTPFTVVLAFVCLSLCAQRLPPSQATPCGENNVQGFLFPPKDPPDPPGGQVVPNVSNR